MAITIHVIETITSRDGVGQRSQDLKIWRFCRDICWIHSKKKWWYTLSSVKFFVFKINGEQVNC